MGAPAPREAPADQVDLRAIPEGTYEQGAASREAQAADLQADRELRDAIEALRQSDLDLSYEDANGIRISLQQALDDLDADEALEMVLEACPTGRGL